MSVGEEATALDERIGITIGTVAPSSSPGDSVGDGSSVGTGMSVGDDGKSLGTRVLEASGVFDLFLTGGPASSPHGDVGEGTSVGTGISLGVNAIGCDTE